MPAGLPSSQRYAPQRLPIGSCPTYGGQAAVQPGSDPQASPSATCQGAARKGWKSASSSHLTLRRNGASSGPVGTSAAPYLLGVLTQGRRCKKERAEPINSATPSASCPSSTYWGYGPAGRRARARQPALSLRRPPQHDLPEMRLRVGSIQLPAHARVIPDPGSSPSRDPEHFSGSRVGILPLRSLRLRIQRLWIPTRAGSPLGDQESVRQEISFSRQQPAARQGAQPFNVQRPASRATPSPRRRPAALGAFLRYGACCHAGAPAPGHLWPARRHPTGTSVRLSFWLFLPSCLACCASPSWLLPLS